MRRISNKTRRILIIMVVVALVVVAAIIWHQEVQYAESAAFYESLRNP